MGFLKHFYIVNEPLRFWWSIRVKNGKIPIYFFDIFLDFLSFEGICCSAGHFDPLSRDRVDRLFLKPYPLSSQTLLSTRKPVLRRSLNGRSFFNRHRYVVDQSRNNSYEITINGYQIRKINEIRNGLRYGKPFSSLRPKLGCSQS